MLSSWWTDPSFKHETSDWPRRGVEALNLREARDGAERREVARALARANGNLSKAADLLGISRPTLYDLLNRFGLRKHDQPWEK